MHSDLPNARGYFNLLEAAHGRMRIAGWMLLPKSPLDSFRLIIDGDAVTSGPLAESMDIRGAFPFLPHASRTVFDASVPFPVQPGIRMITVIGMRKNREAAKLETCYSGDLVPKQPFPGALVTRVAGRVSPAFFRASAFTSFRNFAGAAGRHADISGIRTMLDWGCGCGRLTVMFSEGTDIPGIYGCDIDPESIEWCRQNLKGEFRPIPPAPPSGYDDSFFDLVLSSSVLTHLTKENQLEWLREIRRILAPGGLFLATVHGEFATFFNHGGRIRKILKRGINDETADGSLDGIAPDGYYRGTYQKESYTKRVFGDYFKILEYIEAGSLNFQDLVVMKKPAHH